MAGTRTDLKSWQSEEDERNTGKEERVSTQELSEMGGESSMAVR